MLCIPGDHEGDPALRWKLMDAVSLTRPDLVRRGQRLEYFTIGYNSLEGLVSVVAGLIAGSVSLVGFGLDSAIEVASGAALLWRLHHDLNPSRREQVERITLRIVGWCFMALAECIAYESGSTLIRHEAPERSIPGIIVAAISVVVMPLLARAKRRVAAGIGSSAMHADSSSALAPDEAAIKGLNEHLDLKEQLQA